MCYFTMYISPCPVKYLQIKQKFITGEDNGILSKLLLVDRLGIITIIHMAICERQYAITYDYNSTEDPF